MCDQCCIGGFLIIVAQLDNLTEPFHRVTGPSQGDMAGAEYPIGVAFCAVFEFQKSSHSQPLEWPQVAASGRSVEWPQVTASGRLRRVAEVFQSHKKQPLAATRSHSSGRKWPLFPSGRKWPRVAAFPEWPQVAASGRLYHITS